MKKAASPQLWSGPAGSGKTHACVEVFQDKLISTADHGLESNCYYIIPSQEHSERIHDLVLQNPRLKGLVNHHILTIHDFVRYKSAASGDRVITQFERRRLISRLLQSQDWKWLEAVKDSPGISSNLAALIRELKTGGTGLEEFSSALNACSKDNSYFDKKYQDLADVYRLYASYCDAAGWTDPETETLRYAKNLLQGTKIEGPDLVIFDGFYSFTPSQMEFIHALSETSKTLITTLTWDKTRGDQDSFQYPSRTRLNLLRLGFQERAFIVPKISHRFKNKNLATLEAYLYTKQRGH
jgi:ATP-dependent helicase/DNAse subunit B